MRSVTSLVLTALLALALGPLAQAQTPADIIAAEGDDAGGGLTITAIGFPVVNGDSEIAFNGDLSDGDDFLWYDTGIIWRNADALPGNTLTGFETSFGIGGSGEFAYSPSIDGNDGIWTDLGRLIADDDPAPGFPGQFISFGSRPTMTDDGTPYWISGVTSTQGGSTEFDVLYRAPGGVSPEVVFAVPDPIDGIPTDDLGFDFNVSDNGAHLIMQPMLDTGLTTNDGALVVDGVLVAREGSPTGSGDNWANFDLADVTNDGWYAFSGDTDGDTTTDEFIAVGQVAPPRTDGLGGSPTVAMREGDVVGGVVVDGSLTALDVANIGFAAFVWSTLGGTTGQEGAFVGPLDDLANSTLIFQVGDLIDIDDDMVPDYTIDDVFTTATAQVGGGLALSDDGFLYVQLDLLPLAGGAATEAMVRFDVRDVIPVELVHFSGVADGDAARLTWETASETNNAGFEVQLRAPGQDDFAAAAFVNGHGTTTEAQTYGYTVTGLQPGAYAFRLKQVDFDGQFEYSGTVEVEIGLPEAYTLSQAYPNPFNPTTQFTLAVARTQDVTVSVYDALGRQVRVLHEGALEADAVHAFTLDASALASGTYMLRAVGETFVTSQSVTLLK